MDNSCYFCSIVQCVKQCSRTVGNLFCSECLDPFDNPECEAFDVFVNEAVCIGKGCDLLDSDYVQLFLVAKSANKLLEKICQW